MHRVKAPVGTAYEQFGRTLTAGVTAAGDFVLGIGTVAGCRGYVVTLPMAMAARRSTPPSMSMLANTSAVCPSTTYMTTFVALNALDPSGPLLLTRQSDQSLTKDASYRDVADGAMLLDGPRWTSSSNGGYMHATSVAFTGPLAVIGYQWEDRRRLAWRNGTEAGPVTPDVGAVVIHSGVGVGPDGRVRVAAQTVLANDLGWANAQYGIAVAVVEVDEDVLYHVAVGSKSPSGPAAVHMYSVAAGGGGGGWGVPAITQLANLTGVPAMSVPLATAADGLSNTLAFAEKPIGSSRSRICVSSSISCFTASSFALRNLLYGSTMTK